MMAPKKAGLPPLSRIYFSCKRRDKLEEALHNIAKGVTGLRPHDERQRVDGAVAWRDFCFAVLLKAWRASCFEKKILDSNRRQSSLKRGIIPNGSGELCLAFGLIFEQDI
jgi:hypothetical protein